MSLKNITALDQFTHGRLTMGRGDTDTIEAVEADELAKAGLVVATDTDAKMDAPALNKMDDAPVTKAVTLSTRKVAPK